MSNENSMSASPSSSLPVLPPRQLLPSLSSRLAVVWNKICASLRHLWSLDEFLVVDSLSAFRVHAQRRILLYFYKFALLYIVLHYCFEPLAPPLWKRVTFSILFCYSVYRCDVLEKCAANELANRWLWFDLALCYALNLTFNSVDPTSQSMITVLLSISLHLFLPNRFARVVGMLLSTVLNDLSLFHSMGRVRIGTALMHAVLYSVIAHMSYANSHLYKGMEKICEQAKRKAESEIQTRSLVAASTSHDLKNPLNAILACLEMLSNSPQLKESDRKSLKTATYSGQILQYLVCNILDVSKIDTGNFEVERMPISVLAEIKKILKIESQLTKRKGIALYQLEVTPIPRKVFGDAMRLAQIVMNLVGNAIKFTSKGYVAVMLKWAKAVKDIQPLDDEISRVGFVPSEDLFKHSSKALCTSGRKGGSNRELSMMGAQGEAGTEDLNEGIEEPVGKKMLKYETAQSRAMRRRVLRPYRSLPAAPKKSATSKSLFDSAASSVLPPSVQGLDGKYQIPSFPLSTEGNETLQPLPRHSSKPLVLRKHSNDVPITPRRMRLNSEAYSAPEEQDFGDSGILVLDVVDTGEGMAPEELARIFNPFTQANGTVKSRHGGTGLGLWITRQLVQRLSGLIEVRAAPQQGSRFRVTLPLKVVRDEGSPQTPRTGGSQVSLFSVAPAELREKGRVRFVPELLSSFARASASERGADRVKLLLAENGKMRDDNILGQILEQLRGSASELVYSTYDTVEKMLGENTYGFDSVIVIATTPYLTTAELVKSLNKSRDSVLSVPILIAAGIFPEPHLALDIASPQDSGSTESAGNVQRLLFPMKERDLMAVIKQIRMSTSIMYSLHLDKVS